MATDFTLTCAAGALYRDTPSALLTLLLDAAAGSPVSYALDDGGAGGVFTSTPVVVANPGLSGFFTYRPSASATGLITITAVASGGLVKTHALVLPINFPFVGDNASEIMEMSLGMLGVLAAGEPIPGSRLAQGLSLLNAILDSMRLDSLYANGVETVTGTLRSGVRSLTIGPSGDLVTMLSPVRILDGSFFSIGQIDYPIVEISQGQFNDINFKAYNTIGPDGYWFDTGTPNGKIAFFPQAGSDVPLSLQVETSLLEFADPVTRYGLPPGTKRMLAYTLARDWGPTFRRELTPTQTMVGNGLRNDLQRSNHRTPAFNTRARGNILVGWEQ